MSRAADTLRPPGRAPSIAWPIFALVIVSVVSAIAILFVVTFSGPPPIDRPHPMASIAMTLRTNALPQRRRDGMMLLRSDQPPHPRTREHDNRATAVRIAQLLGVAATDVIALQGRQPVFLRDDLIGPFTIAWHRPDGWRILRSPIPPLFTRWHWATLSAMLISILALSLPAWALARAISRPLRQLADAADDARVGVPLGPLPTAGSHEVRHLTRALSTMHARLMAQAEGRTTMLGAIAHDLGTPLSRLAFWVEQLPDAARSRAVADIDEMRAMIAATLVFARDEAGARADARIDLGSLLDSLVEDMAVAGAPVSIDHGPRAVVRGDSGDLRRLFTNVIDNAVRYGDRAALHWSIVGRQVAIMIDDAGPGIDPTLAERLFEPFVRGDPSRNRATGGTGLGLAIVRSIAERHGGTATLEPGSHGRVRVTLPLA